MNILPPELNAGLAIAFGLTAVIFIMVMLAIWARRRSKGAIVPGTSTTPTIPRLPAVVNYTLSRSILD